MSTVNVDDIVNQKSVSGKKGFFKSLIDNPISLLRIGGIIIIIGAIIGLIINHQSFNDNSSTIYQNTDYSNKDLPSINPGFGRNYNGGRLDTLYDGLGGTDPLKNGKLDANINIDTEKYSCKFNVKYEGEDKKMVECLSGCYNGDENSKFCESYIYNDKIDGGKSLETLYDDAGGNESSRVPGQYTANINVSAGANYDRKDDVSCGFSVEYEGTNRRSVTCNNTDCPDKCKSYEYINKINRGNKGDTLLDDTYINRRDESIDKACQYCNSNQKCVNGECACIDGYEGEYCQKKIPGYKGSSSSKSNSKMVAFSIGYLFLLTLVIFLMIVLWDDNDKFVIPSIFFMGIYTLLMGYASKDWHWLVALWISEILVGIVAIINVVGPGGRWIKVFQLIFMIFYVGNFFIMNNLV